jgi:hypothetical protein
MRYNLLRGTGVCVSELCLGAMTFGGKGFWEAIGKLGTALRPPSPSIDVRPPSRVRTSRAPLNHGDASSRCATK